MFLTGIASLYSWNLPGVLVATLKRHGYSAPALLSWFWRTKQFRATVPLTDAERSLATFVALGMLAQIGVGVALLVQWARFGTAGAWAFGVALLLSYPVVWCYLLALGASIGWFTYAVIHPKKAGRLFVCSILESQVRWLRKRHHVTVVAVAGSVGKTSTKLAIAELLGQTLRVRHQAGNYNDRVTVPLVFFGQDEPSLTNPWAWMKVFFSNRHQIRSKYPYDVVVVELGTDAPGQLADFAYLQPDIAVVTAVSAEHMEFFGTLDAVANEELGVFDFARKVLVNADDIAGMYLAGRPFREYSLTSPQAHYYAKVTPGGLSGQSLHMVLPSGPLKTKVQYLGRQGAKFALAAAAVADMLRVAPADIAEGLVKLHHFSGRMQVLAGVDDSTLIDDTYNASPLAAKAALDVLYAAKTPQRIAILGSMNELGAYSREAHTEVGTYCDPKKLDMVITIGHDAEKWLAPAAKQQGCSVHSFASPYDAGDFGRKALQKGAVVLAKGSQNGVFAEEALKYLLAEKKDASKLVRQSSYWLKVKAKQFPR